MAACLSETVFACFYKYVSRLAERCTVITLGKKYEQSRLSVTIQVLYYQAGTQTWNLCDQRVFNSHLWGRPQNINQSNRKLVYKFYHARSRT